MSEYFRQLFINDTPLLDVRAGTEYQKGAFPTATNIPVLNNQERHDVGVSYKKHGPLRLKHWVTDWFPELYVNNACNNGSGLSRQTRIHICTASAVVNVQNCLRMAGRSRVSCPENRWRLQSHALIPAQPVLYLPSFLMVSGHTGVGKTEFLNSFTGSIDLEGLANHRGSLSANFYRANLPRLILRMHSP